MVCLPPPVHGAGDHGFVPILIGLARASGVSGYLGDGLNRWAGVHRSDAARGYRLALEAGAAGGPFHLAGEEGVPMKEIAGLIGARLGLPVVSKSGAEAEAHFTWFARFAAMDGAASAERTQARLGWTPQGPGLLADLEAAGYFA